ncbi:MAG TPA: poly-gamma-glutamate system protein [Candidatus Cloacimonadota bacterium]|nr:poly-gamma-glutamate system protein [Candidatus Cloacimonadota bacterium]HPT71161.1 poly-gamma-glutamate system protein [Candidatus Cloacimonadota bacterium]
MFRPSLKSNWALVILGILSIVLFYIAQTSYKHTRADYYEEKLQAAQKMNEYMKALKADYLQKGNTIDLLDDPMQTGLIGPKISTITSSRALLSEKQTALNPNLAAIFVQLLKDAHVKEGNYVAVGLTGSNPGMNLALYAAMSVLKVKPVIMTSLSSSMFGANDPNFTWLDMEKVLKDKGLIDFATSYASLGGKDDQATGLSETGINDLNAAIQRNGVQLIKGKDLNDNIQIHMKGYNELLPQGKRYQLFINIGAGLANIGSQVNARLVKEGINRKLADKNFEVPGVMMLFAKKNVPVLHELRILRMAKTYDLQVAPEKTPQVGEGIIFGSKVHNVMIALICLLILTAAIVTVIMFDRADRHFMSNLVDPDEEL